MVNEKQNKTVHQQQQQQSAAGKKGSNKQQHQQTKRKTLKGKQSPNPRRGKFTNYEQFYRLSSSKSQLIVSTIAR